MPYARPFTSPTGCFITAPLVAATDVSKLPEAGVKPLEVLKCMFTLVTLSTAGAVKAMSMNPCLPVVADTEVGAEIVSGSAIVMFAAEV